MRIRKSGRRPIKVPSELKEKIFADYDEDVLTINEIMKKYNLSKYLFYKIMRELRSNGF